MEISPLNDVDLSSLLPSPPQLFPSLILNLDSIFLAQRHFWKCSWRFQHQTQQEVYLITNSTMFFILRQCRLWKGKPHKIGLILSISDKATSSNSQDSHLLRNCYYEKWYILFVFALCRFTQFYSKFVILNLILFSISKLPHSDSVNFAEYCVVKSAAS